MERSPFAVLGDMILSARLGCGKITHPKIGIEQLHSASRLERGVHDGKTTRSDIGFTRVHSPVGPATKAMLGGSARRVRRRAVGSGSTRRGCAATGTSEGARQGWCLNQAGQDLAASTLPDADRPPA